MLSTLQGSSRRDVLKAAAAGAALSALPRPARAAITGPVNLGALLPLTGAGGMYGPAMASLHKKIVEQVNAAGGVDGRANTASSPQRGRPTASAQRESAPGILNLLWR